MKGCSANFGEVVKNNNLEVMKIWWYDENWMG